MTYKSTKLAIYALALFVCFTNAAGAHKATGAELKVLKGKVLQAR